MSASLRSFEPWFVHVVGEEVWIGWSGDLAGMINMVLPFPALECAREAIGKRRLCMSGPWTVEDRGGEIMFRSTDWVAPCGGPRDALVPACIVEESIRLMDLGRDNVRSSSRDGLYSGGEE